MSGPTIRSIFNRIDTRADGELTRAEVKSMVERAKVGGGLFGGIKVNQATDAFMEQLDADKDGKIVMGEVSQKLAELVKSLGETPPGEEPKKIPDVAMEWFARADTSADGKLTVKEVQAPIQKALEDAGQSLPELKAEIAAKIAVHLLDEDGSGTASKEEALSLALDVERETQPPPAPAEPAGCEWFA